MSLSFISANPAGAAYDRQQAAIDLQQRREEERRARDEQRQVDAAIRAGLDSVVAGPQSQAAPAGAPHVGAAGGGSVPAHLLPHYEEASRETGVPLSVLTAQSRLESNFNPNAVNATSGATGIGQILPSTARNPGYGVAPIDPSMLTNPRENILFQARYLAGRAKAAGATDWSNPMHRRIAMNAYSGALTPSGDATYADKIEALLGNGAVPSQAPQAGSSGVNYRPIVSNLARVPGGGHAALGLLDRISAQGERDTSRQDRLSQFNIQRGDRLGQQDQARRDQYQKLAMEAFARGEPEVGNYYAKVGGIEIPQELAQNAGAMKKLGEATTISTRLYGADKAGGARFMQHYLQSGDVGAAIEHAGPPTVNGKRQQIVWVADPSDPSKPPLGFMVDPTNPNAGSTPILLPDGTQATKAPGAAQAGRMSDRQYRLDLLRKILPENEAIWIASGGAPTASTMVSAEASIRRVIQADPFIKPADKEAAIREAVGWLRDRAQAPAMRPGQAPAPAPAAPTAAPPAGAPAPAPAPAQRPALVRPPHIPPGSVHSTTRPIWRTPDGRLLNEDGSPYQDPAPSGPVR